jgi:hypothetical protein
MSLSNGKGYVLSKQALNKLGMALSNDYSVCENTGVEDKDVGYCLKNLKVFPAPSIDEKGRER